MLSNPGFVVQSKSSWIIWNCVRDNKDHLKNARCRNIIHARPIQQVCSLKGFCWFVAFFSVHRYSPAPISIKHLLEHGKVNDNLVSKPVIGFKLVKWLRRCLQTVDIKLDISSRVPSTSWRKRSRPGWQTWSWSWSCCPRTWWTRESVQRSSAITSAASSTPIFSRIRYWNPYQGNGEIRGKTRKRERLGTVCRGNQYHQVKTTPEEASVIISIPTRRRHLDTVPQMAMAVVKLNQKGDISEGVSDTIQYFLDRLYINRSSANHKPILP